MASIATVGTRYNPYCLASGKCPTQLLYGTVDNVLLVDILPPYINSVERYTCSSLVPFNVDKITLAAMEVSSADFHWIEFSPKLSRE